MPAFYMGNIGLNRDPLSLEKTLFSKYLKGPHFKKICYHVNLLHTLKYRSKIKMFKKF